MGRKIKQLKNYTTEQIETLFESDENNLVGVKLYAIIQLTRGYSTRKLEEFYRVTQQGADAVVVVDDAVYIFEFKLTGNATAEEALKQIDERKYAAGYAAGGKKIVKVGAKFNAEERTLHRWIIKG